MKTSIVLLAAAALLALGAGLSSAQAATKAPRTVTVVMHDPGCHWFDVNNTFLKKLTVVGPVKLANFDEAALVVAGPRGVRHANVGKPILLIRGVYHITMVHQAPDDNHLLLVVK
jgi:ABC-type sugar transport system substrate-binding protein